MTSSHGKIMIIWFMSINKFDFKICRFITRCAILNMIPSFFFEWNTHIEAHIENRNWVSPNTITQKKGIFCGCTLIRHPKYYFVLFIQIEYSNTFSYLFEWSVKKEICHAKILRSYRSNYGVIRNSSAISGAVGLFNLTSC